MKTDAQIYLEHLRKQYRARLCFTSKEWLTGEIRKTRRAIKTLNSIEIYEQKR